MPCFQKGSFRIELSLPEPARDLAAEDRQCAWELYFEMASRAAVSGQLDAKGQQAFEGEIFAEEFTSLIEFCDEARRIVRRYPVGQAGSAHLAFFAARLLEISIRPFLTRWRARYLHWWECSAGAAATDPFERQKRYPLLKEFIEDWAGLRRCCREVVEALEKCYGFVPLLSAIPQHVRNDWAIEERSLFPAVVAGCHRSHPQECRH